MAEVTHEQVPTNGIELHVAAAGPAVARPSSSATASPSSGTPGAISSARWPTPATAPTRPTCAGTAGARVPTAVADYGSDSLTGDLAGLLDHYGYDQATFVGHDWGAMVVWEMGASVPIASRRCAT